MDADQYTGRICRHRQMADNCALCEQEFEARKVFAAQSVAQRQQAFRARNAIAGLTEVRGIFLPQALHEAVKEHARKLLKVRVSPNSKTPAKREN